MAIKCGFFNSVNKDRMYQAADMIRPYQHLVSNGVYATPQGTASDYLQVYEHTGMSVIVKPGYGLFMDNWFENDSNHVLTLDDSEVLLNRIDAIVVRIDKSEAVRKGDIIIKKGTPASEPVAPRLENTEEIKEYRLANITIKPQVREIFQADIRDYRGSSECPWVTSLVQQVDTSTLYEQWRDAYDQYYNDTEDRFDQFYVRCDEEFQAYLAYLKSTMNAVVPMTTIASRYVTTVADTTSIPIEIEAYEHGVDVLQVFINGLFCEEGFDFTIDDSGESITLSKGVDVGTVVSIIAYKSTEGIAEDQPQVGTDWVDITELHNGKYEVPSAGSYTILAIGGKGGNGGKGGDGGMGGNAYVSDPNGEPTPVVGGYGGKGGEGGIGAYGFVSVENVTLKTGDILTISKGTAGLDGSDGSNGTDAGDEIQISWGSSGTGATATDGTDGRMGKNGGDTTVALNGEVIITGAGGYGGNGGKAGTAGQAGSLTYSNGTYVAVHGAGGTGGKGGLGGNGSLGGDGGKGGYGGFSFDDVGGANGEKGSEGFTIAPNALSFAVGSDGVASLIWEEPYEVFGESFAGLGDLMNLENTLNGRVFIVKTANTFPL